mgnify:CR=1 FL=1
MGTMDMKSVSHTINIRAGGARRIECSVVIVVTGRGFVGPHALFFWPARRAGDSFVWTNMWMPWTTLLTTKWAICVLTGSDRLPRNIFGVNCRQSRFKRRSNDEA